MNLDEPFPLEAIPSRVRHALLREFKGRRPCVREVEQITDKDWLTAPGMGPASLKIIRSITGPWRQQAISHATPPRLSDAELLTCLERLQKDLRWLELHVKAQQASSQRRRPQAQGSGRTPREDTNLLPYAVAGGEAPRFRKSPGNAA